MYKITITKSEKVTTKEYDRSYTTLDKRPYTQKEVDDMTNLDKERYKNSATIPTKEVTGYPPPREIEKEVETTIFTSLQTDINISEVMKAVYNIKS